LKQDERWSKLLMPEACQGLGCQEAGEVLRHWASLSTATASLMNILFNTCPSTKERENSIMAIKSRKEAESEVRGWGFSHVFTWTDGP
jgi:hypothetical protein